MFTTAKGGTELMHDELMSRLPQHYKDNFSIFNYLSQADTSKKLVYWNQLSYDQEAIQALKDENIINQIDFFVFVSNWQAEKFRQIYGIPAYKTFVIENACVGVFDKKVRGEKIKVCYTSTPYRGLDVLLAAWELLNPQDAELHVFSSCKIYGEDFAASEEPKYEHLYEKCKTLPNVVYRGSIPNDEMREELASFDILAYPCTFEETSCIAVIEALCSGLRVITSNLGALPETTQGWANIYPYIPNKEYHAVKFAKLLKNDIELFRRGKLTNYLQGQQNIYGGKWMWDKRINDWTDFLDDQIIKHEEFNIKNAWDKTIFKECFIENEYGVVDLKQDDTVLDIGGHIGSFARLCWNKGSRNIHGYEADNTNFLYYQANAKEGITVSKKAVWRSDDDTKTVLFDTNIVDGNTGMGVISDKGVEVECIKLDDILAQHEKVRLLKIDVEGSEYPILYTSKQLNKVEVIVGEFHEMVDKDINDYTFDREGLTKFLEDNDFEVTKMEQSSWSSLCGSFKAVNKNFNI